MSNGQPVKLIIYLPAYNEAENIQRVIASLPKSLDCIDTIECLVIDDGSTDKTAELARASGAQVVVHAQNRGVGAAFQSAVQFALENGADFMIGMDADGQFDPAEIPALIAPVLDDQADMVIGNRFEGGIPEHMSYIKYWGNNQVSRLISYVSGQKFQDVSCGYRVYSRDVLMRLNLFGEFTYTHETILNLVFQGQRVLECPIKVRYYPGRRSRVAESIYHYAVQTSKIIFRVVLDYRPMRVFGSVAAILAAIGVGFILFLLGHYALEGSFTPYKSFGFIGLGFFIFGMLVFLIAFIADMINRVRIMQDRLLYELKVSKYEK